MQSGGTFSKSPLKVFTLKCLFLVSLTAQRPMKMSGAKKSCLGRNFHFHAWKSAISNHGNKMFMHELFIHKMFMPQLFYTWNVCVFQIGLNYGASGIERCKDQENFCRDMTKAVESDFKINSLLHLLSHIFILFFVPLQQCGFVFARKLGKFQLFEHNYYWLLLSSVFCHLMTLYSK